MEIPQTCYARTADGIHVGYQVVGSGPIDLVFVPYDYSNIEASWDFPPFVSFVRALTSVGRVILFDRRGSGTSDRVWAGGAATIEAQMDDIRAVMDAVGSERAFIFGIESGAALCFTFAATHPQRTSGVIVHGALARGTRSPDYEALWSHDDFEDWYERVEREWGQPSFVREFVELVSPSLANDEGLVRAFGRYLRLSASPGDAIARDRAVEETDIRHILPTVQVPTLVLHRTGDRLEPLVQARYIAARTPGARFIELPGDDHLYPLDDLVPHIAAFADSIRVEQAEFDRVLATVMYTDIVDSTARAASLGDARWQDIRAQHDAIVRSQISRYRGREIKSMGDGFLVTFDGPARAVRCATTIADAVPPLGIEIRAGLHTGEIALEGADVAGLGVVIGARVGALAGASEVLVSQTVKDLVAGSGLTFEDAGEHELKGVPDRWRLYRVTA
ncbi:MAG TPA: adenylate/guanylate cyclase domain-containing protein [Actinomycetota bacterium]|nr:adenylate/guanylate cyclase domain-containing protein [Actinomycetota bacterium]